MIKCTTVEGHEIKVSEMYETTRKIPTLRESIESGELGEYTLKSENLDVFRAVINYTSDYLEKYLTKERK